MAPRRKLWLDNVSYRFSAGLFGSQHWQASTTTLGALAFTSHEHYWLASATEGGSEVRAGAFARDAAGNTFFPYVWGPTSNLEEAGFGQEPEHRTFEYGASGVRLERVRRNGSVLRDYVFDEAGFVVERGGEPIEYDGAGRPRRFGDRRLFWDTFGRPTAVAEGNQVTTRRFGGRLEADLAGQPLALWVGPVRLDLVAGAHRTHHVDFRGNVKWVSDAGGAAVSHVRYRPFGPDRALGEAPERGFAGGFPVGELVLLGHRLYDPDVGRFLAPDPVFQVVNGYAYTLGNPVQFWDPDGASARTAMLIATGTAVAGMAVGATLVAVAPVTVAAGVTIASAGVLIGLIVPATPMSMAAAKALAGVTLLVPIARGAGLGFLGGQELQLAILDGEPHPLHQKVEMIHVTHHQNLIDQVVPDGGLLPEQTKEITLEIEAVPPGCSPDALVAGAPPLDRRIPLALGALNLLLGLGWAARRRRNR